MPVIGFPDSRALSDRLRQIVLAVARARFGADAQERGENRRLEQHAPMVVDLVLEAGIAFGIGARLALQHDRAAVRHDQAIREPSVAHEPPECFRPD
jgi:hypothetical protein